MLARQRVRAHAVADVVVDDREVLLLATGEAGRQGQPALGSGPGLGAFALQTVEDRQGRMGEREAVIRLDGPMQALLGARVEREETIDAFEVRLSRRCRPRTQRQPVPISEPVRPSHAQLPLPTPARGNGLKIENAMHHLMAVP